MEERGNGQTSIRKGTVTLESQEAGGGGGGDVQMVKPGNGIDRVWC